MAKSKLAYTDKEYRDWVLEIHGGNIIVGTEKYVNNSTPITHICRNNKKHKWKAMPKNVIKSNKPTGCPYCSRGLA